MGDQFGDDDHIAGLGRYIEHSLGHFGAEVFVVVPTLCRIALGIKERPRAVEVALVATGENNKPAIAGIDIGQVEEED